MQAPYARANDWAGVASGFAHRMTPVVVRSRTPWHQSARVVATLHSRWVPTLRLDVSEPLPEAVAKLNAFQPDARRARIAGAAPDLDAESLCRALAGELEAQHLDPADRNRQGAAHRRPAPPRFGARLLGVTGAVTRESASVSACGSHTPC